MYLTLDETFTASQQYQALSGSAKSALEGLLQFATRRHTDWVVEGTPQELAEWVDMTPDKIADGLRELKEAGCITSGRTNFGRMTAFVVRAPVVER